MHGGQNHGWRRAARDRRQAVVFLGCVGQAQPKPLRIRAELHVGAFMPKIAVLKETRPNERRVAMVPAVADKLIKLSADIYMQSGAGDAVKLPDSAFKNVKITSSLNELVADADIVLAVQP